MNDNDNNNNIIKLTSLSSQASVNIKDPAPAETAAAKNKIEGEDDRVKFDKKEDSSESANSIKPGVVAGMEGDDSKIMNKREIRMKNNAHLHRALALSAQSSKSGESGSQFTKKDGNQDILEKKKVIGRVKATSPGVVAVKDAEGSEKKKSQLYLKEKMMPKKESRSSLSSDNKNKEVQVNTKTSTSFAPNVVEENDTENQRRRLKIKLGNHIKNRYSNPLSNDICDVNENRSENLTISANNRNIQSNTLLRDEETVYPVLPTSSDVESVDLEQDRDIVDEGNDNYEIPIAIAVNDSEVVLVPPHAEPNHSVEDIIIVDAKALVPWYKQKKFYVAVIVMVTLVGVTVVITSSLSVTSSNGPSLSAMPSFRPLLSLMPSVRPSLSAMPSLSVKPSVRPSLSLMPSHRPSTLSTIPSVRPSLSELPTSAPSLSPVLKSLTDLYLSTLGDDWINNDNWLMYTMSWCNWYGVTCISGSIKKIDLTSNNLNGSIPVSISTLSRLNRLHLDVNSLSGTIPTEVGLLTSLDYLGLCCNSLTGTIPTEIGLLSSLGKLELHDVSLTGTIPTEIGLLSNLWLLDLRNNYQMSGTMPMEVCNLIYTGWLHFVYIAGTSITNNC